MYTDGCASGFMTVIFFAQYDPEPESSLRAISVEPLNEAFFPTNSVVQAIDFLFSIRYFSIDADRSGGI